MSDTTEDARPIITVHAEVPSDDVIRTFYEVPDSLAMLLWRDKSTTFCEALGDLLAEARDLRRRA